MQPATFSLSVPASKRAIGQLECVDVDEPHAWVVAYAAQLGQSSGSVQVENRLEHDDGFQAKDADVSSSSLGVLAV